MGVWVWILGNVQCISKTYVSLTITGKKYMLIYTYIYIILISGWFEYFKIYDIIYLGTFGSNILGTELQTESCC